MGEALTEPIGQAKLELDSGNRNDRVFPPRVYWEMRARSKEINVEALHNTQGLHTMERED